jgi:hypothetical protein
MSATSAQWLDLSRLAVDQAAGGRLDLGGGGITIAAGGMTSSSLLAASRIATRPTDPIPSPRAQAQARRSNWAQPAP